MDFLSIYVTFAGRYSFFYLFSILFWVFAGYLDADNNISEVVAEFLKDLINVQIDLSLPLPAANQSWDNIEHSSPEISAIINIISSIKSLLDACGTPTGHMLGVISVLFLKLGMFFHWFTPTLSFKFMATAFDY